MRLLVTRTFHEKKIIRANKFKLHFDPLHLIKTSAENYFIVMGKQIYSGNINCLYSKLNYRWKSAKHLPLSTVANNSHPIIKQFINDYSVNADTKRQQKFVYCEPKTYMKSRFSSEKNEKKQNRSLGRVCEFSIEIF